MYERWRETGKYICRNKVYCSIYTCERRSSGANPGLSITNILLPIILSNIWIQMANMQHQPSQSYVAAHLISQDENNFELLC